jgi:hypothetical protein
MHWEELFALLFIYGMGKALWMHLKPLVKGFGSLTKEEVATISAHLYLDRNTMHQQKKLWIKVLLPALMLLLKLDILTIVLTVNIVLTFMVHPFLRFFLLRSAKEFKHE